MTREDFWMQVYMASFNDQHYGDQAIEDANRALAAYDEALKKYGEACKDAPVWPKGSLPWAMAQIPKVPDGRCYALCLRGRAVPIGVSIGMDEAASLEWSVLS